MFYDIICLNFLPKGLKKFILFVLVVLCVASTALCYCSSKAYGNEVKTIFIYKYYKMDSNSAYYNDVKSGDIVKVKENLYYDTVEVGDYLLYDDSTPYVGNRYGVEKVVDIVDLYYYSLWIVQSDCVMQEDIYVPGEYSKNELNSVVINNKKKHDNITVLRYDDILGEYVGKANVFERVVYNVYGTKAFTITNAVVSMLCLVVLGLNLLLKKKEY